MIGSHSKLILDNKVAIYKSIIKPVWTYGIQLYVYTSNSNIEFIQRAQSKILRTITRAPWYIRYENIHKDLQIPFVKDKFKKAVKLKNTGNSPEFWGRGCVAPLLGGGEISGARP